MNAEPSQRAALVTGGAVRLGRAICLGLAEAGYDVALTYRSSADAAARMRDRITELGRRCETVEADLAEADAAARVVDAVHAAFGRLDLLVNSASSFEALPLLDVDADAWDRAMALNARAPHLLVREAAGLLRAAGGSVINLVDLSVFDPWAGRASHSVSKAALAHLTKLQAKALAPEVRVNAIAPGAVLPPTEWSDERVRTLAERAPLGRLGTPQDVVEAVLYLAGADFVTGHVLPVDGGRSVGRAGPD